MLVVDASAIVELLLARSAAEDVAGHIVAHDYMLHAPHLLDVEILSALRRVLASGEASPNRALEALADLSDLPVERYPHDILIDRIWNLKDNLSAYDATYLALADLLTRTGRHFSPPTPASPEPRASAVAWRSCWSPPDRQHNRHVAAKLL